ncbi:MAG: hypothetical protein ASARMPREDX12_003224 [Alectoria sarmentosa]|nr:MAG: hypothetical protein ASARMPREDX12_003224 [Alectoria sarmentosa]
MALSSLRADFYNTPGIVTIPPIPAPGNITTLWPPFTVTLLSSDNEAVLVDTLLTKAQAGSLADWIEDLFPDKRLTYIYVTHGHGDHFLGLSTLLDRFPNATAVATKGTLAHMEELLLDDQTILNEFFPGHQIDYPASPPAKALPSDDLTIDLEGHKLMAVPAGHSDTDDSSFLWVPDLKMAIVGDIVQNGVYSWLAESLNSTLRQKWIQSIDKVKSFHPETVVVGHKQIGAPEGTWTLSATQDYIRLWGRLADVAKNATDMFQRIKAAEPDYSGAFSLWWSCLQQFPPQ